MDDTLEANLGLGAVADHDVLVLQTGGGGDKGSLREGRLALSVAQEGHVGLLGQGVRERGGDVRDETRGERGALEERLAAGGEARGRLGGLRCRLHDDGGAAGLRGDLGGARGDGRADARGGGEGEGTSRREGRSDG